MRLAPPQAPARAGAARIGRRPISVSAYLTQAAEVLRAAASAELDARMERAIEACVAALTADKPLLVCGNGGSAPDAMHIAGELVGRYLRERRALNVICLSANPSVLTAWANDYDYESVFAREVEAHGQPGGVLLALSTSGNSPNVLRALEAARAAGMTTLGLTGAGGGKMAPLCDILLEVPSSKTPEIQQGHICLYHFLCEAIEARI